jgi:hypothetical protein
MQDCEKGLAGSSSIFTAENYLKFTGTVYGSSK